MKLRLDSTQFVVEVEVGVELGKSKLENLQNELFIFTSLDNKKDNCQ